LAHLQNVIASTIPEINLHRGYQYLLVFMFPIQSNKSNLFNLKFSPVCAL
jgi:hypothetical protein